MGQLFSFRHARTVGFAYPYTFLSYLSLLGYICQFLSFAIFLFIENEISKFSCFQRQPCQPAAYGDTKSLSLFSYNDFFSDQIAPVMQFNFSCFTIFNINLFNYFICAKIVTFKLHNLWDVLFFLFFLKGLWYVFILGDMRDLHNTRVVNVLDMDINFFL